MKEKMKRDRDEREEDFFAKNVSEPSHPPDELAQNVSKKSFPDGLFLYRVFNYLDDSNSIFRARRIYSELVSGRTVSASLLWSRMFHHHCRVEIIRTLQARSDLDDTGDKVIFRQSGGESSWRTFKGGHTAVRAHPVLCSVFLFCHTCAHFDHVDTSS